MVARQHHAQLIAVGDSAQAIYGWRGAGDFLARIDADYRLALTQSWRFGQAVADEANVWLGVVGTDLRVVGNPGRESTLDILETPDAVLFRSNAGTIEQLLAAHDKSVKVHLVGDGKEMRSLAEAAERLQDGKPAAHPELVAFTTWQQVVEYAENDPAGSDLTVAVRMIERYGADEVIRAVDGTVPAERADLRVSTAHKAKGLEWEQVRIGTDYREPLDGTTGKPLPIPRERRDARLRRRDTRQERPGQHRPCVGSRPPRRSREAERDRRQAADSPRFHPRVPPVCPTRLHSRGGEGGRRRSA